MVRTLLMGAITAAAGAVVLDGIGRLWRRRDASLWHSLWLALAASSLLLLVLVPAIRRVDVPLPAEYVAAARSWPWMASAVNIATWTYFAGVGWFTIRLVLGFCLVSRLARQSRALEGWAAARLRQISPEAAPLCRVHPRVQVPMTIGVIRPIVVLPETAVLWPIDRLAVVLSHELAHVRRRDYAWHIVAAVHQAVYWFSPVGALIARRVRLLAELASDQRASALVGRKRYATQLVAFVEEQMAAGMMGHFAPGASTDLAPRIRALVAPESAAHAEKHSHH